MTSVRKAPEWLLGRALRSAAVLTAASYLTGLISFPANLALVRLVGPAEYGRYALAMAVLQMVYLLGGWSFQVRIAASVPEPLLEDTAFTLSCAWGLALGALMVAIAPWVSRRFGAPVAALGCGLAAVRIVTMSAYVYGALLERDLRYGAFALVDAAASLLSFGPALWGALHGWGAWALVAREGALAALALIGYRACARRSLRPRLAPPAVRDLLAFGAPMAVMQACMTAFWSLDRLALGWRQDAARVGIYSQARYLADAAGTVLGPLVTQVAVPIYARSNHASNEDAVYAMFAAIAIRAALIPMLLLALFPHLLVRLLLGVRWAAVGDILPFFAPYVALLALVENQRSRLTGLAQTHRLLLLGAVMLSGAVAAAACAVTTGEPRALAATVTAGLAAVFVAGQRLIGSRLEYRRLLAGPLVAFAGAAAAAEALMAGAGIGEAAAMVAGLTVYAVVTCGAERRQLGWLWRLLRSPEDRGDDHGDDRGDEEDAPVAPREARR